MEIQKDRKNLAFPCVFLVGRVKNWRNGKLFYLVEEKSKRIENIVYINLFLTLITLHVMNNLFVLIK